MGQRFILTEQEKNSIVSLYEQQVKPTSKFNAKDLEVFKKSNFSFKYDDIDDKITVTYYSNNLDQFLFFYKSITKNKIVYGLMFHSPDEDNTYGGDNVTILFTDNTRFVRENIKIRNSGATLLLTAQEALLFTNKVIKKYRIVRTTDVVEVSDAIGFKDAVKTIYKITYNDTQFIQKHTPEPEKEIPQEKTPNEPTIKSIEPRQTVEPTIGDNEDKIYTVAQIPAEFPGGFSGWQRYLERTLNKGILKQNNAPEGKYSIIVSFVVDRNGSISDIKAENDPGYGTKEEAIRVIEKGPKWKPAVQNGRNVNYRHRQSITFQ